VPGILELFQLRIGFIRFIPARAGEHMHRMDGHWQADGSSPPSSKLKLLKIRRNLAAAFAADLLHADLETKIFAISNLYATIVEVEPVRDS
jgi:hypothetical protein